MPAKRYLMTPGPTPVPPEVLSAMSEPIIHHRAADFRRVFLECLARLAQVYRTASDVLMFTASGTGAMESAVANLCSPGDPLAGGSLPLARDARRVGDPRRRP